MAKDKQFLTDLAHGGGTSKQMDGMLEEKINCFCMLHNGAMEKWLHAYECAVEDKHAACSTYRHLCVQEIESCDIHQDWKHCCNSCHFDGCMILSQRLLKKDNMSAMRNGNLHEVVVTW